MFSKLKILGSLIMLLSLFGVLSSNQASAHTVTETGSESRGFVVTSHTIDGRTTTFYYTFTTEQFWKDRMDTGRYYLNSETNGKLTASNYLPQNATNFVEDVTYYNSGWVARTLSNVSGQHKTMWIMQFNAAYQNDFPAAQWSRIAQHELGHVFGLKDLTYQVNINRLMWQSAGNYAGLTQNEKYGLGHIWGY
ncbi:hypothetical protein [Domibacillus aminovorans]|uniref:Peptidase M10 metallopeptidase domain-containing protein n=1 Tax=Domibacillus aminovorans TaxID=29332 RepID=A0A177L877_9BACI|nr:hypothetical protein [Domibacillus aminovorans]OAH61940.1 hypothetical protein AWH49_10985 [Domibacillus aminovorans]